MKEKKIIDLSDDELLANWKNIKLGYQMTLASLIISIIITVGRVIMYGFGYYLFLPLFIGIISILVVSNYKLIKKEVEIRNLEK